MVRDRPASGRHDWRGRLVPWEGRAAPADIAILICIAVVLAVGVVARLLTPFLIALYAFLGFGVALGILQILALGARVAALPWQSGIYAFPIGVMSGGSKTAKTARRRRSPDDEIDLSDAPVTVEDDDDVYEDTPVPRRRSRPPSVDARWVMAWLAVASILAGVAVVAAAMAVLYL